MRQAKQMLEDRIIEMLKKTGSSRSLAMVTFGELERTLEAPAQELEEAVRALEAAGLVTCAPSTGRIGVVALTGRE